RAAGRDAGACVVQAAGVAVSPSGSATRAGRTADQQFVSAAWGDDSGERLRGCRGSLRLAGAVAGRYGHTRDSSSALVQLRRGGGAGGALASAAGAVGQAGRSDQAFRGVAWH